jgi:2',3'-cyclic-nucleotide 2'-phosphodiesterase (5'-nucleotidase family)
MGGLARRVSYLRAFKHRSNLEVPTLFLDAGNLFTDERFNGGQLASDVMSKNRWVVKAYGDFNQDAANIGEPDIPYVAELLKKDGFDKRVKEFPFISKLVSANVTPADDSHVAPRRFVIREVVLKRSQPGRKLRIGIVGFMGQRQTPQPAPSADRAGFKVDDPFEAAKRVIPEVKKQADVIVALAYMTRDQAQRLASENPDIDTVIGANQINNTEEVEHFNRATITYAFNQTKYVGELRYYVRPDGTVENQVNRFIALDSIIPDDPAAEEVVTAAHNDFTNEQNKRMEQQQPASLIRPDPLLAAPQSSFIGAETCAGCHTSEFSIWRNTRHAHAMATLERKNQQFDTECVGCHVVGFGKGGFTDLKSTPQLANVQCESCHGPGRNHSERPAKGYGFIATPVGCVQCHTQVNSPDFNFATYWPQVQHGAPERAAR